MNKSNLKISPPHIRLNSLVIFEIILLLVVSLGTMFYFVRRILVEESKQNAEQRLEATVQHVDNILLSVEQSAGNIYWDMVKHLDQPDSLNLYCRHLIECNPNIMGCAIALQPNYYPDRETFIAYVHRKSHTSPELIESDRVESGPYTEQKWYTETMATCRASWLDPSMNHEKMLEPVITFCLPLHDEGNVCVGVMAVGLSVNLLSHIVLEAKSSTNSYSVLLSQDGSYIVHPDRQKLAGQKVFDQEDIADNPRALAIAKGMTAGATGNMSFPLDGETWYAFFKPFVRHNVPGRSTEALQWSIATIYPKGDIFSEYNHHVLHILGISFASVLLFYMLCRKAIRRQLKPLIHLTESAEDIADGKYDEEIPDTKRDDEVGYFQQHFQRMQQALSANIRQQEELTATLQQRREQLQTLYKQTKEDDHVKTIFLHNVTGRMISPAESLLTSVTTLCDHYQNIGLQEANREVNNIRQQSETILELLSHKFSVSPNESGKEENHE